jgi:hypothetical protein
MSLARIAAVAALLLSTTGALAATGTLQFATKGVGLDEASPQARIAVRRSGGAAAS